MAEHPTEEKKPLKGVLKPSSGKRPKNFQWDEMNILATYHPADKTYGHMKIDEPKTPFVFEEEGRAADAPSTGFAPEDLAARLCAAEASAEGQVPKAAKQVDEAESSLTDEQRRFREKRRAHYNEFIAAKMAKEHLHEGGEDAAAVDDTVDEEASRNARYNAMVGKLTPMETTTQGPVQSSVNKKCSLPSQRHTQRKS